ncbi:MAG: hypothetical protein ACRC1P_08175 [Cellulosilyticaceae bacterium]
MPTFYYSDISGKKVLSYTLSDDALHLNPIKSISFTEGFLPSSTYTFYQTLINDFMAATSQPAPYALHDFYESETLAVLSFNQSLSDLFIIEKDTCRVHTLEYPSFFDLGPMYVSHMQQVGDYLFILAGEAESYRTLLYKVYLPTFEVIDAIRLNTHPSALSQLHYALTPSGQAVFINGKSLKVYDAFSDIYQFIPLDYTATEVIVSAEQIISLGQFNEKLNYSIFDLDLSLTTQGTLTLPSEQSLIVDYWFKDHLLYVATFDPKGIRYANYLTLYDLTSSQMLYSLGIKPLRNYALLGISTTP